MNLFQYFKTSINQKFKLIKLRIFTLKVILNALAKSENQLLDFWPKKETVYHVYPKGALLLDIIQLFVLSGGAGLKKDFFM